MSNFVPKKMFLQGVLLHYFNMKKTAAKSHRILVEVYGRDGRSQFDSTEIDLLCSINWVKIDLLYFRLIAWIDIFFYLYERFSFLFFLFPVSMECSLV